MTNKRVKNCSMWQYQYSPVVCTKTKGSGKTKAKSRGRVYRERRVVGLGGGKEQWAVRVRDFT